MRKVVLFSFLLFCSAWVASYAQDRKVTGKVTAAEDGSPLPGVSVVVKGSSKGTNTTADGSYSIDAPSGTTLVFSFVGTTTQEIGIGNRTALDVALAADTKLLSEVVVTAQGIVREKRALGYSVASVDSKSIQDRPQADVGRVLQGKIAGVNITSTSGVSGTGTNITIRGYSSITGSVQPLFVVDGVPFNSNTNTRTTGINSFSSGSQTSSSRFLDIDPNNIENVTVLKGLAATVTYGDQGRNGVILITTKNGSKKARKTEFSVTQSFFTNTAHLPRYQNDYVGGFQQNLGYFFSNWGPTIDEAKTYPSQNTNAAINTHPYAFLSNVPLRNSLADYVASVSPYEIQVYPNNVSDFFRTGQISNTSMNISGGGEKVSYNVSAGYNKEGGYIPNNDLTRLNLGLGLNAQMTKKLTATVSFNYANTAQSSPPLSSGTGNNANDFPSVLANVLYTPRQVDLMGWPYTSPLDGGTVYFRSGNDIPNPRWVLDNYKTSGAVNRIFMTTTFNYELGKDLMLLFKSGLDTYDEQQEFNINKGGVQLVTGLYNTLNIKNTIVDNSLILSYTKSVSNKLSLSGKVGGNLRNDRFRLDNINSQNQLVAGLFRHGNFIDNVASNFTEEQTRMGVFGEITADYNNFLFANIAARNDWTSTVEKENRRILYPSASISFVPTTAFKGLESPFLSFLKIRAGVGSSAGFPNPYSTRNFLNQNTRAFLNPLGQPISSQSVDNTLSNPNLRPELHTEYEFGVEGKFFRNRIGFDLTLYRRDTRDLITRAPLDASTGYTSTTINIGKIRNEGIEISLNGNVIKSKDFSWDITGTFSRNRPKVLDLGGTLQEVQISGFNGLGNFAVVGEPFNIIKGTGYRRTEGTASRPTGPLLIDSQGLPISTPSPIFLGDPNPAFNTSLINEFSYKGISLSFMLSYRHGGAMYSSTAGALLGRGLTYDTGLANGYDRAQTFVFPGVKNSDKTPNDIQVTASDVGFNAIYFFGDEGRIFDGSTIRLQELSLGYQLPKKLFAKLPIKGASFQFTGNNLWYKALNFPPGLNFDTDNLGLGVGNGLGFEFLTGPSARRLGVTLKLTF
ncbi:MAG: SusC/RagA family TonB-linked outer membrane protein [Runella slithyformis]|nr:MAG: SusC/RagA family TonB-linked outer membrane protein [Runella slithyformis]TAF29006.1 MAG: SusC/RagA family TonB-linked outer membrane protein [Runella slithyformis]TAF46465.1 MAG: SusC/RagA family TonB-linked outer membrane protein [Runella slithyformis]TAF82590.1 MAG: SusC/RagA family TonB-linked outer membrane protein [Runella slithyformis]